ncbi:cytochrome P450 [Cellulomonas cellasea]|uniref:Cytochrome P450 n=1 Tax=Cellulomonas cellasea TaxID=43670 RepID=A0A7W4UJ65_9CELL|nr:cytochrome P450 [Cellulomonas cellasea]MBB2924829.1 cytochrome P450 [Cellulomonas cellasea]
MSTSTLEHRTIPTVRGLPLVGSVVELSRDPAAFFVRAYLEHGPVYRVRALNRTLTVLAGPGLARWMGSREGQGNLRSAEVWQGLVDEYGATRTLTGVDGPEHKRLREVMRRGYSREALEGRLDELVAITDACLDRGWRPGTDVPVVSALQLLVTSQLGTLLTGRVPVEHIQDIRTTILYILNALVTRQRPEIILRNPVYRRAKSRVNELGEQMIRDHRARGPVADGHRTLVDDLMDAHDRDPGLVAADDLVLALTGPYVAGLDTVANTLGSLVHAVLAHPEVLARIQAEADEVFARGPLTDASVEDLTATNGAVMEAMRLYPIAVAQPRVANRDFEYAGFTIREGEPVYCAVTVPHFLPEMFPDPERFDIDRYGPERREHATPGAYSPFGRGPHTCLGKGIADVQMTLTAARLFHRLDLALPRGQEVLRRRAAPTPGPVASFRVRVDGVRRPGTA